MPFKKQDEMGVDFQKSYQEHVQSTRESHGYYLFFLTHLWRKAYYIFSIPFHRSSVCDNGLEFALFHSLCPPLPYVGCLVN